ncbi:MAG: hypothetical protein WAZ77_21535 [Candidatus Nitrosopolaris sp.]
MTESKPVQQITILQGLYIEAYIKQLARGSKKALGSNNVVTVLLDGSSNI